MFTFLSLDQNTFLGKFGKKYQNSLFKMKFGAKINANVLK